MKKFLAVLLVLAMIFALAACGKDEPAAGQAAASNTSSAPAAPAAAPAESSEPSDTDVPDEIFDEPSEEPVPSGGFEQIYEYNGTVLSCTKMLEKNDNGDLDFELILDGTQGSENVAVQLADCSVNGFDISTPSITMSTPGSESDVIMRLWTSAMAQYGLQSFADVKVGFKVYNFDPETYDIIEPAIASIDPISFTVTDKAPDTEPVVSEDPIYDQNGIKVYSVKSEAEIYSLLNLYVVNESGKDVKVTPADLEMNGEKQDVGYSDYTISVHAGNSAFAAIPLPNYTINTDTWETTKFEVTSYKLNFEVE